ncbi:Tigger transposable element-derived protein 1 [Plecturocebus cupreus]
MEPCLPMKPLYWIRIQLHMFKWKSHTSLTFNEKLEMMTLSEESMSKADIGQNLDVLHQVS